MDAEHQRLIDICTAPCGKGVGLTPWPVFFDELVSYTRTHFSHEERLMQQAGYPDYDAQKTAHETLVERLMEIREKFVSGIALSQEVMTFLKGWFIGHIQGMDKKYGPHLNRKGLGRQAA